MEVTILRLPHMDIVLNRDNGMEEEEEDMQVQKKEELILRRSTRHMNQEKEQKIGEKDAEENIGRKKRFRLRQNSVMDEDEEEERYEEKEMKRKEPGHRRQNRIRQESVSLTYLSTCNHCNLGSCQKSRRKR